MRKRILIVGVLLLVTSLLVACGGGTAPATPKGEVHSVPFNEDGHSYTLMVETTRESALLYVTVDVADATSLSGTRTDGAVFYVPKELVSKAEGLNGKNLCAEISTSSRTGVDFDVVDLWEAPGSGCH